MRKNNIMFGITFIAIGGLYLLNIVTGKNLISFSFLWPILLFIVGLSLELKYFRDRSNGSNLIPGGILMVLGSFFLVQHIFNDRFSAYSWAFYSLSLAVGFLQYYFLYKKDRIILILALVFIVTFVVKFFSTYLQGALPWLSMDLLVPVLLIALGILVIIKK